MHPVLSDRDRLLGYMAAWLLAGSIGASLLRFTGVAGWGPAMLFALPLALVYGFVALSAYYVCRSLPYTRRSLGLSVAVFGGASLVSALIWTLMVEVWNSAGPMLGFEPGLISISANTQLILFVAGAGLYLLSLLAHDVLIAFENLHVAARHEAESRVLAREAELQVLRMQINPHFLFNSLNSISALTSFDAAAARAMTIDLAQFFRRTLTLAERDKVTLAEEVALCEHYLAIEQRRFGDKLCFSIHIDPEATDCLLPPMLLQPLVENAVKHGIRHLDDGGNIQIEGLTRDGWLHIAVSNPLAAQIPASPGNGLGLHNIRERLAAVYGPRARLVQRREPQHFRVELALPMEQESMP